MVVVKRKSDVADETKVLGVGVKCCAMGLVNRLWQTSRAT